MFTGKIGKTAVLAAAGCAAALSLSLSIPASADINVNESCSSHGQDPFQDCSGGVLTRSLSPAGKITDAWDVSFTLSKDNNCAPLMLQIREAPNSAGHPLATLGNFRLDPGQTTPVVTLKNYDNKGTSVELHAVGIQEGCNTGSLMAWSGDLHVVPNEEPS
jgi:hypothetical protein